MPLQEDLKTILDTIGGKVDNVVAQSTELLACGTDDELMTGRDVVVRSGVLLEAIERLTEKVTKLRETAVFLSDR